MIPEQDIQIFRGTSCLISWLFQNTSDGTPIPLIGISAQSQIRTVSTSELVGEFTTSIEEGQGKLTLSLNEEDTLALPLKACRYDVKLIDSEGNSGIYIKGNVHIADPVTRSSA